MNNINKDFLDFLKNNKIVDLKIQSEVYRLLTFISVFWFEESKLIVSSVAFVVILTGILAM